MACLICDVTVGRKIRGDGQYIDGKACAPNKLEPPNTAQQQQKVRIGDDEENVGGNDVR